MIGYPYEITTPHGIGPHDGIELDLMLQGIKKVALFSDSTPDHGCIPHDQFAPFIETGQIKQMEFTHIPEDLPKPYVNLRYVYYYIPGFEQDAKRLHGLNRKAMAGKWEENGEYEIGRILGYKDWQIKAFIDHITHMRTLSHDLVSETKDQEEK